MAGVDFSDRAPVVLAGTLVLAVAAGLAAALAQPPWGVLPGLLGLGLLMPLIDRLGSRRRWSAAFTLGWLAGLGYFIPSLIWLAEPFKVDAQAQGWMAPFAVALMAGFLAVFWGVAALVYRLGARRDPLRVLFFAGVLTLMEWLRGHVLTGLPWDLPGEAWRAGSAPSQAAALVGAYGLTWLTLVVAASPFTVFEGRRGRLMTLSGLMILAGLYAYGEIRLTRPIPAPAGAPWLRIVQADVKQESKYDKRIFTSIVSRYVALTAQAPAAGVPHRPDIVIWPEGAIPAALEDYLAPDAWTAPAIAGALSPNQTLILGGYRFDDDAKGAPITFNSLAVIRPQGGELKVIGLYDKHRLVPFGEYMPFDSVASRWGIKQFVHVGDGFTPGPPPRPLNVAGLPLFQPLICYESLFPGFTRDGAQAAGARPSWIVNISNDAWFGQATGPRQHLNIASYRAIEEGLPMVRATPTGISAVIDAHGRIVKGERLGMGAYGVIDAPLPGALPSTLYSQLGDGPLAVIFVMSLTGAGRRRRSAPGF
jgi:apolipoprotein N-acyltransferase